MVQDRKINMTISWRPDYSNDTVALSHLTLNRNASKLDAIDLLLGEYGRNVVFFSTFGNMAETLLATVWAPSSKTISGIVDGLMAKGMFDSVVPNVICEGCFFDTWKEKMLDKVQLRPEKDR